MEFPTDQQQIARTAAELAALYRESFGGKGAGKFRISRKFLRQIARRQRLPEEYLRFLTFEMFERGFVLVDLESFFVVMDQKLFSSYRRVTGSAIARVEEIFQGGSGVPLASGQGTSVDADDGISGDG